MAESAAVKFKNDVGANRISIGTRTFQCTGATPPHDHPHIYLDMGEDSEIVCPYCSTLFKHDPGLEPDQAIPPECAYAPGERS